MCVDCRSFVLLNTHRLLISIQSALALFNQNQIQDQQAFNYLLLTCKIKYVNMQVINVDMQNMLT